MPLVKAGKVVDDPYLRILDDAAIPTDGAVLVPAARLLADAVDLAQRSGTTGVLWPNDRSVSDLAPHLDRTRAGCFGVSKFQGRQSVQPGANS